MLKIEELTKYYDETLAVDDLSLNINKGEIFGFIGPNGAGKSTTIRSILKLVNKTKGKIFVDNEELGEREDYKLNIGYLPSEVHLYGEFTVKQMLEYSESFYKKDLGKRMRYLVKRLELDMDKKIEELSFGNLKKVGIVLALMHEPKLLILDEPTSGLDPLKQEVFFELLEEERKKGTTIFLSSHNLSEVKRICDRVGIIRNGKLIEIKEIAKLSKSDFVTVKIVSKEIDNLKIPSSIIIKNKTEDSIVFLYRGDVNNLLEKLVDIKIKSILIEEPSLEEIFKHYYEED